jgi:hypothetical protein
VDADVGLRVVSSSWPWQTRSVRRCDRKATRTRRRRSRKAWRTHREEEGDKAHLFEGPGGAGTFGGADTVEISVQRPTMLQGPRSLLARRGLGDARLPALVGSGEGEADVDAGDCVHARATLRSEHLASVSMAEKGTPEMAQETEALLVQRLVTRTSNRAWESASTRRRGRGTEAGGAGEQRRARVVDEFIGQQGKLGRLVPSPSHRSGALRGCPGCAAVL